MAAGPIPLGNASTGFSGLGYFNDEGCYVNLLGDYGYMTSGYYLSQDLEAMDKPVHPTCKEMLDAYIVPLFLEKARLAGLKVPLYYMTNDFFEPRVIVDSINPFMSRQSIVLKPGHQERVARSLTRNFTYAMCCQELPIGVTIGHFRAESSAGLCRSIPSAGRGHLGSVPRPFGNRSRPEADQPGGVIEPAAAASFRTPFRP